MAEAQGRGVKSFAVVKFSYLKTCQLPGSVVLALSVQYLT